MRLKPAPRHQNVGIRPTDNIKVYLFTYVLYCVRNYNILIRVRGLHNTHRNLTIMRNTRYVIKTYNNIDWNIFYSRLVQDRFFFAFT